MAKPAFNCRILSLNKTKLGESDLIITGLKEDGSLIRAVAKGARKPTNPFSARLDVFSVCDCQFAQGRSLHVVSEAKSVSTHMGLRCDPELNAAASPVLESLSCTCQEDLEVPRLFEMSCTALAAIEASKSEHAVAITAGYLLKLLAMHGFKPSFTQCVICGEDIQLNDCLGKVSVSYPDGGCVCESCSNSFETIRYDASLIVWAQLLLMGRFSDFEDLNIEPSVSFAVLQICHMWLRENLGINLRSLNYLFSCGLF